MKMNPDIIRQQAEAIAGKLQDHNFSAEILPNHLAVVVRQPFTHDQIRQTQSLTNLFNKDRPKYDAVSSILPTTGDGRLLPFGLLQVLDIVVQGASGREDVAAIDLKRTELRHSSQEDGAVHVDSLPLRYDDELSRQVHGWGAHWTPIGSVVADFRELDLDKFTYLDQRSLYGKLSLALFSRAKSEVDLAETDVVCFNADMPHRFTDTIVPRQSFSIQTYAQPSVEVKAERSRLLAQYTIV